MPLEAESLSGRKKNQANSITCSDKAGLYVHVPFCVSKCTYCSFVSSPGLEGLHAYLETLEKEIALRAEPDLDVDTVHLGGGTPSLLPPGDVGRILEALSRAFFIEGDAEITLEANPGTLPSDGLSSLRRLGVNRLVLGAQSFDSADLEFLGRIHSPRDTVSAFDGARKAGFENLGLDLIYALPDRNLAHWKGQIDQALALGPEHLSCYALTIEEGTPLRGLLEDGGFDPPGEEEGREMFVETHTILEERGYPFYEVSNFSREGNFPSRHNDKYWTHAPYLGFGPSAHSFRPPRRRWNTPSLAGYVGSDRAKLLAGEGEEELTPSQLALESIALGLRTRRGVDLDRLEGEYLPGFRKANREIFESLRRRGLVSVEGPFIVATLEGRLLADRLPLEFILSGTTR